LGLRWPREKGKGRRLPLDATPRLFNVSIESLVLLLQPLAFSFQFLLSLPQLLVCSFSIRSPQ
jgi:hypothetical protein